MTERRNCGCHTKPEKGDDVYWCSFEDRWVRVDGHEKYCKYSKPENGKCCQCALTTTYDGGFQCVDPIRVAIMMTQIEERKRELMEEVEQSKCADCIVGCTAGYIHRDQFGKVVSEMTPKYTEFVYCPICGRKL